MIRRDYLLRMIEQCIQALARSLKLTEERRFDLAGQKVEQAVLDLTGKDLNQLRDLSEPELTALLLQGEGTQMLGQKAMLLVALLHRTGEICRAEGKTSEGVAWELKALHVSLEALLREGPFEFPGFVPTLDVLLSGIPEDALPLSTHGALMQYYERSGQFAKAEDALFAMLDLHPANPGLLPFGVQFYERLLRQSDESLLLGDLPRPEVQAGLAELKAR